MSMRKTQLDASIPQQLRGSSPVAGDEQPQVNYYLPLVATLFSALAVVLFVAIVTFMLLSITQSLLSQDGALLTGGACGLVTLVMAVATIFFVNAVVRVVRDFFTPLQITRGVIVNRQKGRGRSGANWISVSFEPAAQLTELAPARPLSATKIAPDAPLASTSGQAARQITPAGEFSFGAGLGATGGSLANAKSDNNENDSADLAAKLEEEDRPVKGKSLRVDKHVFEALAVGDEVLVAYSKHIEHVYYVQRLSEGGNNLLLRNLSLI